MEAPSNGHDKLAELQNENLTVEPPQNPSENDGTYSFIDPRVVDVRFGFKVFHVCMYVFMMTLKYRNI